MNFFIYDIILLIVFATFISIFLYSRKKNLKKEGLLLLYKTSWGIKLINKLGNKYRRVLTILGWISIILGYVLMVTMLYLFGKIVWVYLFSPEFVRMIKIPPIMPLIPYLPSVFKLEFLPPFYFIYWIAIIAIAAIPHELFHGIYSVYNKVKIKTTGFGFFPYFCPVFLAAFVELDEKTLSKRSKFGQLATLSAGTFANILTGIFFFFILWGFFSVAYAPAGAMFDIYAYSAINVSNIQTVNGITLENGYDSMLDLIEDTENINEIVLDNGKSYWISKTLFENPQQEALFKVKGQLVAYEDSPAVKAKLTGAISKIDKAEIRNRGDLVTELAKKVPGQVVTITTVAEEGEKNYNIILGEHPEAKGLAWLGIGFLERSGGSGILGKIISVTGFFRDEHTYYESRFEASEFIYNLLWWIVLISFSIALINMLPVGMFDGGRFFYLTVAAITGSEKIAKRAFSLMTKLFLFFLLLIMAAWVWGMFF